MSHISNPTRDRTHHRAAPLPAYTLAAQGSRLAWSELHRLIVVGAFVAASTAPSVVAALLQRPIVALVSLVLPATTAMGAARFADELVQGNRPRLLAVRRHDVRLGILLAAALSVASLLASPRSGAPAVGYVLFACIALLTPYALAYSAARERYGLAAWRGAVILVALRPSWALTLLALGCISAFAVVASWGVLGLVVPPWLFTIASCAVRRLLQENRVIE